MEIREVGISKIKQIYATHMVNDFPAAELKPFKAIESLISKHNYQCFALYSQGSIVAYAFCCFNNLQTCFLLDYYAVIAAKRGRGHGSQFLTLLKEKFCDVDGFLVEVEKVESVQKEQERKQREKRINFYLKNGMRRTSVSSNLLGVDFDILYQPLKKNRNDYYVYNALEEIYSFMYPEQLSDRIVLNYAGDDEGSISSYHPLGNDFISE
ncbi:MAG: N-acetyltransferase [Firmicutes bacterium]|nr:N-acetyltransferase [Bacillota bacterium]